MFLMLVIQMLEKFNGEINKDNINRFLKQIEKLEEEEHQNFLKNLNETIEHFEKLNEKERKERLDYIRSLEDE